MFLSPLAQRYLASDITPYGDLRDTLCTIRKGGTVAVGISYRVAAHVHVGTRSPISVRFGIETVLLLVS